jgi:opine dehydrogenase
LPKEVTTDPEKAVRDAEIIMFGVPAYGHETFMESLVPHFRDGQIVVFNTGYWASLRFRPLLAKYNKKIIIAETDLIVYLCHVVEPGCVHVDATKGEVVIAAMPANSTDLVYSKVKELYSQYRPERSVLEVNFICLNAFVHTPLALLNTSSIEHRENERVHFYRDFTTERVCHVVEALDRERMAIADALGMKIQTFLQRQLAMYGHQTSGDNVYDILKNSPAHQATAIPGWRIFGFAEQDMPYTLIPAISIAEQIGIQAPIMRSLVQIQNLVSGKDYWSYGATAERLGFAGMNAEQIRRYVETGQK